MNYLKNIKRRVRLMSRPAYLTVKYCIILSNILLVAALLIRIYAGPYSASTYELHHLVRELYTMPQAILLISGIGSLVMEDLANR